MSAWGYDATTTHKRFAPRAHSFAYRLFYLCLDADRIGADLAGLRLIAYNKAGVFSIHDADHGARDGRPLRAWAEETFLAAGVDLDGGAIRLVTLPRMLGFVFNPLSLVFGYGRDGGLRGIIYEVRNTFGERHAYAAPAAPAAVHRQIAAKTFYVSPFFEVRGHYLFAVRDPSDQLSLTIEYRVEDELQHRATLAGARVALTDRRLAMVFFTLPLMTLGVVVAVHWQAVKLWAKGARYRKRPAGAARSVSAASFADPAR